MAAAPKHTNSSSSRITSSKSGNVILGKYQLGRLLGRGSFAKVYSALSLSDTTSGPVAIKVIDKRQMAEASMEPRVLREISAMSRLSHHPNILKIHEVLATRSKVYLVMDLARGGDLSGLLARRHRLTEGSARRYFLQLASAVAFCHANGVTHRDIKPQNILVDDLGDLKVTDFGLAALGQHCETDSSPLRTACGTPAFTAPEVVRRGGGGYDGGKADAFSLGIMLYLFLFGYLPFDDSNLSSMYKKILRRDFRFPTDIPVTKQAKFLVYSLLDPNPNTRMGIKALIGHSWFKKLQVQEPEQSSINSCSENKFKGTNTMNAFDIISMSSGLDLSGLFEAATCQRERRFKAAVEAEERMAEVGSKLGYRMERKKGGLGFDKGEGEVGDGDK